MRQVGRANRNRPRSNSTRPLNPSMNSQPRREMSPPAPRRNAIQPRRTRPAITPSSLRNRPAFGAPVRRAAEVVAALFAKPSHPTIAIQSMTICERRNPEAWYHERIDLNGPPSDGHLPEEVFISRHQISCDRAGAGSSSLHEKPCGRFVRQKWLAESNTFDGGAPQ